MSAPTRYVTVVLELPASPAATKAVLDALPLFGKFKEARVSAMYAGDAITENELLEQHVRPTEVRLIREQASQPPPGLMTLEA